MRLISNSTDNVRETLTRLLAIEYRSLPMFLMWACPYRDTGDDDAWKTIKHIVNQQTAMSGRISELITDRGWRVDYGDFPITFTGSHDLSLQFLVRRLIDWQKGTVTSLEQCYRDLADDPTAQAVADECLGEAKGHLESLEELVAKKPSPPIAMKLLAEDEPAVAG
jgi:hypothetical protein